MMATQEFVVPRSIPMTLLFLSNLDAVVLRKALFVRLQASLGATEFAMGETRAILDRAMVTDSSN